MKLKYLLTSLLAAAAFVTACEDDEIAQLDQVKVSQSYVAIPVEGGTVEVTVNATSSWAIEDVPSWLSVDPASGSKGKSVIKFSAPAATETNESVLHLTCDGATQLITVLQMAEKVELPISTCAEIIAGQDSKQYRAKGTCTAIANTEYGNWYLTDETGSVYIYGTLDANGAAKNFLSLGIEVGDIVTVEGPRTTYGSTVELVDVTVINIEKSLIKVEEVSPEDATLPIEGGEFTVSLTVKGDGVSVEIPESAKPWLSVSSINISGTAATVVFNAASNEGGDRKTDLTFLTSKGGKTYTAVTSLSQKGAIIEATAAEINAAADGDTQYRITGYVSKVANTKYGNLYIRDYTGEVYVYGTNDFAASGVEEGDIITVVGPKTSYKEAPQMANVTVENRIDVQDIDLAGFKALEDNKEAWYRISGKVAQSTEEGTKWDLDAYGNFALTDGTTEVYVYGVVAGWGGAKGKFGELGVKEGDNLTIVAYKTSYKGLIEAAGCFYVSHEAGEAGGDEPVNPAADITFTDSFLPTAYPTEETAVTAGDYGLAIYNVANFGNGIQMKKGGSYIYNSTAFGKIKSIKLNVQDGKTWYPDNLKLYAGSAANPTTEVALTSSDETGSVYDLSAGDYSYIKIENPSGYAVYMGSIDIYLAK
ncbi:MAG: BACON domain-containing protein [Candidatus Cryptobacteroides sp.]